LHLQSAMSPAERCRRRFLRYFPDGFRDELYIAWEREYKAEAHARWKAALSPARLRALLANRKHGEIAATALAIESRTNLLFSFEKMAVRDAVRSEDGARAFAIGLHDWLHGAGPASARFQQWCTVVESLPRRGTRVLTWPVTTVFGFIAQPGRQIFLKPNVTRLAAARYGFDLPYEPRPNWTTYHALLRLAALVRRDQADLGPRDLIDVQSFLWVQGSEEYQGRTFRPALTTTIRAVGARATQASDRHA
jgi:hypothetical protein